MQRFSILISTSITLADSSFACVCSSLADTGCLDTQGCFLLPQSCSSTAGPPGSWSVGGGGQSALLPRDSAVLRYCIDLHLMGQELEKP